MNLSLKIRTQAAFFRVIKHIVWNVNSNLAQTHPKFEPFEKISKDNPEKGEVETEIDKTGTANEKVETKNKKRGRPKAKNKAIPQTTQKFQTISNSSTTSQPAK